MLVAVLTLWLANIVQAETKPVEETRSPLPSSSNEPPPTNGLLLPTYSHANGLSSSPLVEPFDPNAPPRATIPIGPDLFVGGYTSLEGETNRHYDLSSTFGKADSTLTPIFAPAFAYEPNQYLQLYVNPVLEIPIAVEEIEDRSQTTELNMNLAFLTVKNVVPGTRLQVGRQRFIDSRRWLFNENMDAIRLGYQYEQFSVELSVSQLNLVQRNLLRREAEEDEEGFVNYYAYADYKFGKKNHIGLFALYQDQQRLGTAQPITVGLQTSGRLFDNLKYWLQTAAVRGSDGGQRIRGEAIDVGLTQVFDRAWEPSLTIGYAYGTGDSNPNDNVDARFRQTGFQGNSDKLNGVARFKYYGEVLDPRLTNLMVFTGGVGIKPLSKTSFDLVYHYYLQDHASKRIGGSDLDTDPTGLSKHIGSEVDLVVGYQGIPHLQTKFVLGYFFPGKAFNDTWHDGAFLASFLLRYNFY
ncbi:alginate export family protein [Nitrospira sp. BLG_1]|uniref:alginate export family protein n=1 Tax=Nitrospira sp. BLG_1 TaxID=3395883 RepID=UPI0039BC3DDF